MTREQVEHPETLSPIADSRWPACAMLMWGTFGTKSPAERRYLTRVITTASATAIWIVFFVLSDRLHWTGSPVIRAITPLVVGILFTVIAWEFRRYLYELDELARRMQLEAMAWTYITGMLVAGWMGALLTFSHTLQQWILNDRMLLLLIPFLYFLLEPVRAGWLYYLSRKY